MESEGFDSLEEMMQRMQEQMKAADARVQPWQAEIKPGQYFIHGTQYGFDIYGNVLETYQEEHMKHYRFCKCHSIACPEGELGDVHVSVIGRTLSQDQFSEAREQGWNPEMSR